ncbi:MAG: DUF1090 family protein [Arsenophonus endosymbiont of Dermacentor nuttalli]
MNHCEIKKQKLQTEIEYTKKMVINVELMALENALKNLERNCTPESIYQKNKNEVDKKRLKVKEREVDLKAAQAKGDKNKINKQQQKLQQDKAELHQAEAVLATSK